MPFKRMMGSITNRFGKKRNFISGLVVLLCGLLVLDNLSAQGICFTARRDFRVFTAPSSVAVGDFNGDAIQDLAVADGSTNVSILLGNGDGTFQSARNFWAGDSPRSVVIGDFNKDSIQDLAVASFWATSGNTVAVLLGNGDGTFRPALNFAAGTNPSWITVGDFNKDSIQDLAVANQGSDNVSVLIGNGDGTFRAAQNFGASGQPISVTVGDFNRDGIQDLAVGNGGRGSDIGSVSILLGTGTGTFGPAQNFAANGSPGSVTVGDFNRDGIQDLAVANTCCQTNTVSILLGRGDGTFQPAQTYTVIWNPTSLTVGDFNGDSIQDLAVANTDSANTVSVLLGNSNGTFQPAQSFTAGPSPSSIAVGDFNKDGRPDLVVANKGSNNVSILLGINPTAQPQVVWKKDYIYVNGQLTTTIEKP